MWRKWYRAWQCARQKRRLNDARFSFLFNAPIEEEMVVFDTETTGLDTKRDSILSIGAVKIKGNKILTSQTFEVLIDTPNTMDTKAVTLHGIRPMDTRDGVDAHTALEAFLRFIGSRPLVGYYLEFDVAMINALMLPYLGAKLCNPMIEVSEIYYDKQQQFIPQGHIDLRFETLLKTCGIPNMGQHNAVNDAIMTAMIYLKLTKENS
ncbi:MAG: DNA polymerase III subunit epsilon [Sulfuricurvum sp. PC08-66]|nr:MAG: DNA polymerase III subunit epsilon [Sulfuricurvum sp. PC08-66]